MVSRSPPRARPVRNSLKSGLLDVALPFSRAAAGKEADFYSIIAMDRCTVMSSCSKAPVSIMRMLVVARAHSWKLEKLVNVGKLLLAKNNKKEQCK